MKDNCCLIIIDICIYPGLTFVKNDFMRLCLRLLRSYLMMDHPLLLHWFTVNPSRRHPKLTGLPIGLSNRRMLNDPEAPEPNADMEKFEKYLRYFHKTVKKDL